MKFVQYGISYIYVYNRLPGIYIIIKYQETHSNVNKATAMQVSYLHTTILYSKRTFMKTHF